jgi:hypothetical protein
LVGGELFEFLGFEFVAWGNQKYVLEIALPMKWEWFDAFYAERGVHFTIKL